MPAYCLVYDSRHLQADCKEAGSAPKSYARQSSMGYLFNLIRCLLLESVLVELQRCGKPSACTQQPNVRANLYVLLGFYIAVYLRCIIQCCPAWQLLSCMIDCDCCVCRHNKRGLLLLLLFYTPGSIDPRGLKLEAQKNIRGG